MAKLQQTHQRKLFCRASGQPLRVRFLRFVPASIAQLAEHLPRKQKVASSILAGGYHDLVHGPLV